jgi:hypothetical protein
MLRLGVRALGGPIAEVPLILGDLVVRIGRAGPIELDRQGLLALGGLAEILAVAPPFFTVIVILAVPVAFLSSVTVRVTV